MGKRSYIWLGLTAAVSLALAAHRPDTAALAEVLAFPFAPLGRLLRRMSLSGGVGNAAAVAVYALACLIPAGYLAYRLSRRRARPEDALLAVMTGVAFPVLYWAVNPGSAPGVLGGIGPAFGGGVFWSLAVAYTVLRVLRGALAADGRGLLRYARVLLWSLAALSVFGAFGASPLSLMNGVRQVREGNAGSEHLLGLTYGSLALRCACSMGAYLLDTLAATAGLDLLSAWEAAPWSEQAVQAAGRLSRRCVWALVFTALTGAAMPLLQLVFVQRLHTAAAEVHIPLLPMALVLAALLLARYLRAGKALKDDNDLFV